MGQDQRNTVPVPGSLVDEVDIGAVELRAEMFDRVQLALLRVPIEPVGPIREQLFQVLEVSPLVPGRAWSLIRPARVADALPEVRQDFCLDLDRERGDAQGWFHNGSGLLAPML